MTVSSVYDCDPTTGNPTKKTYYKDDGRTVCEVNEYDPTTGNPTKTTYFKEDGRTIDNIEFYGSNGEVTKIE